ncbi:MAG: SIS domain-containing protein [Spirochaetaceae bacterium]|nr:SIS domain-containing protein [Spirochaetaceae bacterium]MCF7949769.1 SIS domain-containing protein [Spirochaetia bacterium]MCF7952140.1 SIS domain-containing protein [Spirochaetaceae bacterium]
MNTEFQTYYSTVNEVFNQILTEEESIQAAAKAMAESIADDGIIHVIGPGGHSNMAAEEVLWRAGGLAPINAILDAGTNLIHGAKRSNYIERTPGYAQRVMDAYRVGRKPGEVIIIANAYGINSMCIDTVLEAKKREMVTIGITSKDFADNVPKDHPARHPSGKSLYKEADYFINQHLPYGDAVVQPEGCAQKIAPTSTLCNVFAINLLMIETVKQLIAMGIEPPLWMSANLPGGDDANKANEEKYIPLIRHLG